MSTPTDLPDPADVSLLKRLGGIAERVDPPPTLVFDLGRSAFALRRLDDELAELVADSLSESALVRGPADGHRLLTFGSGSLTVELQVSGTGAGVAVLGQVSWDDAGSVEVSLETGTGTAAGVSRPVQVDDDGRFVVDDVPRAVVRLRVVTVGGRTVTTAWVRL